MFDLNSSVSTIQRSDCCVKLKYVDKPVQKTELWEKKQGRDDKNTRPLLYSCISGCMTLTVWWGLTFFSKQQHHDFERHKNKLHHFDVLCTNFPHSSSSGGPSGRVRCVVTKNYKTQLTAKAWREPGTSQTSSVGPEPTSASGRTTFSLQIISDSQMASASQTETNHVPRAEQ